MLTGSRKRSSRTMIENTSEFSIILLNRLRVNNFAVDLLVPDEQLKDELAKDDVSIESLAKKFMVTKSVVRFKLRKVLSKGDIL